MQIVNQEQKVIIDWSILKGVSTEIEDFSITDKLVIFLIGGDNVCDKIPVYGCQSVNTAFSSSVDASGKIHIEIDEGLPTGLYSLKAVWVKNARRVIPNYAEKRNIFSVTDVEDEATNPGAGALKLKLNSHVHSYGYDGLDAYEIAFMTGATELKRSQWVFNDEQVSQSELLRVAAENARVSAENARVSAESGRVSAESGRVSAESSRVNAENQRVQTENVRNTAEGGRVSSEYSRTQSERFREQSESQRVGAEMNRSSNEDGRVLAEAGRVSAESGRVSAENARVSAEEAREGAEAERASMFNTSQAERQSAFEGSESSRQSTFSTNEAARQATASADHTTATNDHTQAGTDHVQAVADHVQAVSDHGNAVLTTQGQGLSDTQKENARGNIGAAKDSDVTDLAQKVGVLTTGLYYGYFASIDNLPESGEVGYAYVGASSPFAIYNFNGSVWSNSGATIENLSIADDEDLTSVDGKLKLKDRNSTAGMGYVILRKDKTFAEQVTKAHTVYEVRYDFDLNNTTINIPSGCLLKFVGGKLSNGSLNGNSTNVDAKFYKIFENITFAGTWNVDNVYLEWFGGKGDGSTDDSQSLQRAVDVAYAINSNVAILGKTYKIADTITLPLNITIRGLNRGVSIIEYTGTTILFTGDTSKSHPYNFFALTLKGNSNSILFDVNINGGEIAHCIITSWGVVFNKPFKNVSHLHHCSVKSIFDYLFYSSVTDSLISDNYLNGYRPKSAAIAFNGSVTHSTISGNYIDYFKRVFYCENSLIESSVVKNRFDLCYRVFDCSKGNGTNIKNCSISNNVFYNIDACVDGETSVRFLTIDEEMQKVRPSCIFSSKLNTTDYSLVYNYGGIINTSIIGNYFAGDIVVNSSMNGVIFEGNTYGNGFTTCILSYTSTGVYNQCHIDYFDNKDIDNLYDVHGYYNGCVRKYKSMIVYGGYWGGYNSVKFWTNIFGEILVEGTASSILNAQEKGCEIIKYKGASNYSDGEFKPDNYKECTDFNEIKSGWVKLYLIVGKTDTWYYNLNFYDENKNKIGSSINFRNATLNTDIPENAKYYIIIAGRRGYLYSVDVYGIKKAEQGTTAQRPILTPNDEGFEYYDSTLKKKILWNGTSWINLDGTSLG